MRFNFKTKLPACFQNYRGPKLFVHSCTNPRDEKELTFKKININIDLLKKPSAIQLNQKNALIQGYLHPKTLVGIPMALFTNSGSFPSNLHVSMASPCPQSPKTLRQHQPETGPDAQCLGNPPNCRHFYDDLYQTHLSGCSAFPESRLQSLPHPYSPLRANAFLRITNIKTILVAGVPSSQALPGFLITAPPSVCVSAVLVSLVVWIQNQKKSKNNQPKPRSRQVIHI